MNRDHRTDVDQHRQEMHEHHKEHGYVVPAQAAKVSNEEQLRTEALALAGRLEWGGVGETARMPSATELEAASMIRRYVRTYSPGCLTTPAQASAKAN